ncbi:MAG: hypothetical protein LUG13_03740 [Oscillospiraceae bacterium]|nr:hypothetical protein [Oscillospiraceae bacterium]
MKKFTSVFLTLFFIVALSTSCTQTTPPGELQEHVQSSEIPPAQSVDPSYNTATAVPSPSTLDLTEAPSLASTTAVYPDIFDLAFSDLTDMTFTFSSGAGAWCTEITISSDGSFSGYHSDQDMGDTGLDYPNGTRYYCSFSGKFTQLTKTGDHEYAMKCETLTQNGVAGETTIGEDGIRYITSTPYGFDNADTFALYLPGIQIKELPEEFIQWVSASWSFHSDDADVLPFYGLYNIAEKQAFIH